MYNDIVVLYISSSLMLFVQWIQVARLVISSSWLAYILIIQTQIFHSLHNVQLAIPSHFRYKLAPLRNKREATLDLYKVSLSSAAEEHIKGESSLCLVSSARAG